MLHILIDIPTHSLDHHATLFLWPISDFCFDGLAWRTPCFWAATYAALLLVYAAMWKVGLLSALRSAPEESQTPVANLKIRSRKPG